MVWIWSDNGQHFHSDLFFLYLEQCCKSLSMYSIVHFINNADKIIICNYHEPYEGRCDLDRFFRIMTGYERRATIQGIDIRGYYVK